jgi:REP element-mobilizing transposase RayT
MPCYLFTFHAYRSWMPDRPRGFVKRGQGVVAANVKLAKRYADRAVEQPTLFSNQVQQLLLYECQVVCGRQTLRLHFVATDPTHVHILVSWRTARPWSTVRSAIKSSLTRRLNRDASRRSWFSNGASRKRVADRKHFTRLVDEYLAAHRGWKWDERRGACE